MTKQRERFEAWYSDPARDVYVGDKKSAYKGWKAALELCAKSCDDYAVDRQALFEGRPPYAANEPGCADPHTQGESDGAESCAEIIRKMMKED